VGEEGGEPALTEDGETEKDQAGEDRDQHQFPVLRHGAVLRCDLWRRGIAGRERA
jgi:hypothetical protein